MNVDSSGILEGRWDDNIREIELWKLSSKSSETENQGWGWMTKQNFSWCRWSIGAIENIRQLKRNSKGRKLRRALRFFKGTNSLCTPTSWRKFSIIYWRLTYYQEYKYFMIASFPVQLSKLLLSANASKFSLVEVINKTHLEKSAKIRSKNDGSFDFFILGWGEASRKAVLHRQHRPLPLLHRA